MKLTDKQKIEIIHGLEDEITAFTIRQRENYTRPEDNGTKLKFNSKQFDEEDKAWMMETLDHFGIRYEFV